MRPLPSPLRRQLDDNGRSLTVLVLRFGALGDVLRTLPPVRLIRAGLPEARVVWVVDEGPGVLLEGHRDLHEIVTVPRARWDELRASPRHWPALVSAVRRWARELRARRPGLALDFHGNLRSGIAGWLSRAPVRLGYSGHQQKEGNRLFTTHRVPAGARRVSRIDRNLALVRGLGLPDAPLPGGGLDLGATRMDAAREVSAAAVGPDTPFAILSPGASRRQAYKRPPASLLASAARVLADRGIAPLVVYGPGEESDARRVVEEAPGRAVLAPPTTLWTLAALLREARLFVGGDSGPLHLACAVGCPVVGIYGPTDPAVNAPWGVPHRVVHPPGRRYSGTKKRDRARGGFDGITARAAEQAVTDVLERAAGPST